MTDVVEDAISRLRSKGLRITDQRRSILSVLAESPKPQSAEETHSHLPENTCDLVTAYRCLEQFEKAGIVELGVRENGKKVYCLGHGQGHHHHLTCRNCGHTERVDLCMGKELEEIGIGYGFTKITHVMEAFGLCPQCS